MARCNGKTITVEFFGHWGLGKTTVATEVSRLLSETGLKCASASEIALWRGVAGVCLASALRMSYVERLNRLIGSIAKHPIVAGTVGWQLVRAGYRSRARKNRHARSILKNVALQRAIATLGCFDVVVWDEGSITSACAGSVTARLNSDQGDIIDIIDVLRSSIDEESHIFVGMRGDIDIVLERWNHRYPHSENSLSQTRRLHRARANLWIIEKVIGKLSEGSGKQVLLLDAQNGVDDNAIRCLNFIRERLNRSRTVRTPITV